MHGTGVVHRTSPVSSVTGAATAVIQYFLQPQVFLSPATRYVVILDVRRDRYFCVLRSHFEHLAPWLNGWSVDNVPTCPHLRSAPGDTEAKIASQFIARGILTLDPVHSKPVSPISIPPPRIRASSGPHPRLHLLAMNIARFYRASRRADVALKRKRFETIINAVAARGRRNGCIDADMTERAAFLAAIFDILRPLYPRPYLCIFDSLALLEFLAFHGIYPRWVFGVNADPFHAHCWVQCGETVLNDRLERVLPLAPIMAV